MNFSNLIVTLTVACFAGSAWALTVSEGEIAQKSNAVAVGQAVVNGQQVDVLTDASGMSLYTFAEDTSGKSNCTAGCVDEWPPLNVAPNTAVSAPFGVINGNNGKPQLTLLGLPLYHFAGDSKPGDANGNYPEWSSVIVTTRPAPASGLPLTGQYRATGSAGCQSMGIFSNKIVYVNATSLKFTIGDSAQSGDLFEFDLGQIANPPPQSFFNEFTSAIESRYFQGGAKFVAVETFIDRLNPSAGAFAGQLSVALNDGTLEIDDTLATSTQPNEPSQQSICRLSKIQ